MSERVYIFLDESGNLDFGSSGTRYFVLTSVCMQRPFRINDKLDDYKYDCIESGASIEYFHCYNDRKAVRSDVFDLISAHIGEIRVDFMVVEKAGVALEMQDGTRFYPAMLGHLLRLVLQVEAAAGDFDEVIVITDTIPVNRRRRTVAKAVRTTLSRALPRVKYRILHHQSRSHYGLQIADYCSWAIFRGWQRGERVWYDRVRPAVRNGILVGRVGEEH